MNSTLLILRLIHVLGGVFWVGSMLFIVFFLMPTLAQIGPAAGQVMAGLQKRRQLTILPGAGLLTILSGLWLMWISSDGFAVAYFASPHGLIMTMGAGVTVLALILGFFIVRPATIRATRLVQEIMATGPTPEKRETMLNLRDKTARFNLLVSLLLIVAATTMALARYVH